MPDFTLKIIALRVKQFFSIWWNRMRSIWLYPSPYLAMSGFTLMVTGMIMFGSSYRVFATILTVIGSTGLAVSYDKGLPFGFMSALVSVGWLYVALVGYLEMETLLVAAIAASIALSTFWSWYRWLVLYFQTRSNV